ncbi:histidine phosphatase family protein [Halarcobacter sp.]|uniref:histidine phosphatase family protein n=1 Tax=Halarcobacter sp. TaxID=2321133 RepID=UPI003A8E6CF8
MATITFLRHAPLALKNQKCYNGHIDLDIDTTLVDFEQIKALQKQKYDLVYSSDLKRCTQTLDLLKLSYKKDERLREVKFKDEFEGKSFDEISKMSIYDEKHLSSFKSWHEFIAQESIEEYKQRVNSFLLELPKNKDILVCSHGGTIKLIHSFLTNTEYEQSRYAISYLEILKFSI